MTKHRRNNKRKNWKGKGLFSVEKESSSNTVDTKNIIVDPERSRSFGRTGLILGNHLNEHCLSPTENNDFSRRQEDFLVKLIGDGAGVYVGTTLPRITLIAAIVLNRNYKQIYRKISTLWRDGRVKMYARKSDADEGKAPYTRREYYDSFRLRYCDKNASSKARSISFFTPERRRFIEKAILDNPYATPEMITFTLCCHFIDEEWGNSFLKTVADQIVPTFKLATPDPVLKYSLAGLSASSVINVIYDCYGQFFSEVRMPDCNLWWRGMGGHRGSVTFMGIANPKLFQEIEKSLELSSNENPYFYQKTDLVNFLPAPDILSAHEIRYQNVFSLVKYDPLNKSPNFFCPRKAEDVMRFIDMGSVAANPPLVEVTKTAPIEVLQAPIIEAPKAPDLFEEPELASTELPKIVEEEEPELASTELPKIVEENVSIEEHLPPNSSEQKINSVADIVNALDLIADKVDAAFDRKIIDLTSLRNDLLTLYRITVDEKTSTIAEKAEIGAALRSEINRLSLLPSAPDLEAIKAQIDLEIRQEMAAGLFARRGIIRGLFDNGANPANYSK